MALSSPQTYLHLLIALLMLALPGMAVIMALRRWLDRQPMGFVSALLPGFGLSIALWPLLLLYISLVGLSFTPWLVWAVLVLSGGYVLYEAVRQKAEGSGQKAETDLTQNSHASRFTSHVSRFTLLSLLALTLLYQAFRLGDVAGLSVPMFGDSMHHTMITTLIVDGGKVPTGYLPYVPVDTFTYHFGFHTMAAVFAMLTGSTPEYAVLLLGQVLITLSVPLAYLLNRVLFGSRLAGLGSAFLTAVVSLMPAFYVNWGRYTQLSGHLLLIVALVALVRVMRPGPLTRRTDFVLLILSVGGLVVVHYRILLFFGLFAIALGTWQLAAQWGRWRDLLSAWGRSIAAMALGLLLALPWIINLITNYIRGLVERLGTVTADYLSLYNDPNTLLIHLGRVLPLVALLGLVAGVVNLWQSRAKGPARRDNGKMESVSAPPLPPYAACLVLTLWAELLVASLWVVPGAIGSYTVAITLYIPLSALGGYGIRSLCTLVQRFLRVPRWVFTPLLVLVAPIFAFLLGTAHVAAPATFNYLQGADERAFQWVKSNVPGSAKFLISSEFSYSGRAVTASDAGMWLPLLTGRNVSVPALNSWMERPIETDFFTRTRQLAAYTQPVTPLSVGGTTQAELVRRKIIQEEHSLSDPAALDLMRGLGVTHVYVGAQAGASKPRLDVLALRRDTDHYKLLYFEEGVYIFEVVY